MPFDSLAEFWSMGGHGFYVWTVVLFFALLLVLNLVSPSFITRRIKARLKRQQQLQQRR